MSLELTLTTKTKVLTALFVGASIRFLLAFSFYGGGDATNGASFVDFVYSGFDVYSVRSPWPYLPFTNAYAWLWGILSNLLHINVNLAHRLTSCVYDIAIGVLLFQYSKQSIPDKAIQVFWLYMINPVTIFIVSLLGFTDSTMIFFLLVACYYSDFHSSKTSSVVSAISLAMSISLKPIGLIFIPYFFMRSIHKARYVIALGLTTIILNSYYIIGASLDDFIFLFKLIFIKISIGHQFGDLGLAPVIVQVFGDSGASIFVLISLLNLIGIAFLYVFYINKLDSIRFCFLIFLLTLLVSNHIKPQYLFWIIPFAILTQVKSWPYQLFGAFFFVTFTTDSYMGTGALSPHVALGNFSIGDNSNSLNRFIDLFNNVYLRNILYLTVIILLVPKGICQSIVSKTKELYLRVSAVILPVRLKNILLSLVFAVVYSALFFYYEYNYFSRNILYQHLFDNNLIFLKIAFFNLLLIILPTIIGYYVFGKFSSKKYLYEMLSLFVIVGVCWLAKLGFHPHFVGFIYPLFIVSGIFIIFGGYQWIFYSKYTGQSFTIRSDANYINKNSIFIIGIIPMLFIFVFSWQTLFNGVDNKFYEQFENGSTSYSDFDRGRYDKIISVKPPENGFNYGQNYIFKATFDAGKYIEKSYIQVVSEDHSNIFVNGNKITTMYGSLYYFRHSSKRRDYDYGIHNIDISKYLRKGTNELIIWNNLSAPVHPIGIGVNLIKHHKNGNKTLISSDDLKW